MLVNNSIRYLISDDSCCEYTYAGLGGPETPVEACMIFEKLATYLSQKGCVLRAGGDHGGDAAFESGAVFKEIYLPYLNYNANKSGLAFNAEKKCVDLAKSVHPAWHRCSEFAKRYHSRSVKIILGPDYSTPVKFLVCWTPDGAIKSESVTAKTGMSRVAISLALKYGIPVLNAGNAEHFALLKQMLIPISGANTSMQDGAGQKKTGDSSATGRRKGFLNLR